MVGTTVVVVGAFPPQASGHGGHHRAYQVMHDLQAMDEIDQVVHVMARPAPAPSTRFDLVARRLASKVARVLENPLTLIGRSHFHVHSLPGPAMAAYREICGQSRRLVCVLEDPASGHIARFNRSRHIPTVVCPQNVESLDSGVLEFSGTPGHMDAMASAAALGAEYEVLRACDERLFISTVETALWSGFGLVSRYYPYRPVGSMRIKQDAIRDARDPASIEAGTFLLFGNILNPNTHASFHWFLDQAHANGLPSGVRVLVAGRGTNDLRSLPRADGIDILGELSDTEVTRVLSRVGAVLIPRRSGFGAFTRLADLSCAGVPALVAEAALFALSPPPGMEPVGPDWPDWVEKLQQYAARTILVPAAEYASWEERQRPAIQDALSRVLADLPPNHSLDHSRT